MTVLPLHEELPVLSDGNDIAEFWIFQDVEVLYLCSRGQFYMLAPGRKPRFLKQVLAFENLPFHRVFCSFTHIVSDVFYVP